MLCSEELTTRLARTKRLWLFLDYDGTLAEFAPTPDVISPDPKVIDLLARLAKAPGIQLGVLSGRRLAHVKKLLPVPQAILAGTYGIEIQTPQGGEIHRVDYSTIRPLLEELKPQWAQLIEGREGYFLEDKDWAIAIHARHAPDQEQADEILAQAHHLSDDIAARDSFRRIGGYKFIEVGPRLATKHAGVHYMIETFPWSNSLPIYIGDDDKDEEAFAAIKEVDGVAIVVSSQPRETLAECRLEAPPQVHQWLENLMAARTSQ